MATHNATESVKQQLDAHDLTGAIEAAIAYADEAKSIAQEALTNLDERLDQLNKQADAALKKYELL
jgi:HPt (histidine-containing phosphotransfer) domain-containing protein